MGWQVSCYLILVEMYILDFFLENLRFVVMLQHILLCMIKKASNMTMQIFKNSLLFPIA